MTNSLMHLNWPKLEKSGQVVELPHNLGINSSLTLPSSGDNEPEASSVSPSSELLQFSP